MTKVLVSSLALCSLLLSQNDVVTGQVPFLEDISEVVHDVIIGNTNISDVIDDLEDIVTNITDTISLEDITGSVGGSENDGGDNSNPLDDLPSNTTDGVLGTPPIDVDGPFSTRCNFCDANMYDTSKSFSGSGCASWDLAASFFEKSDVQCTVLRALAVHMCDCPDPSMAAAAPDEPVTCDLCPDQAEISEEYADQTLVLLDVPCQDVLHIPAVDGQETCDAFHRWSYLCGCPNTKPSCSLCEPDSDEPSRFDLEWASTPMVTIDTRATQTTCIDYANALSFEVPSRCDEAVQAGKKAFGLDVPAYCGCPNVEPIQLCEVCPDDFVLRDPNSFSAVINTTCGQWSRIANSILDESMCAMTQPAAFSDCCIPSSIGLPQVPYTPDDYTVTEPPEEMDPTVLDDVDDLEESTSGVLPRSSVFGVVLSATCVVTMLLTVSRSN